MNKFIYFLSLIVICSCAVNDYHISHLKKENHIPGHNLANPYSSYSFEIELKKYTEVDTAYVEGYPHALNWYYRDLETGVGSTKKQHQFASGNYEFGFRIEGNKRFKTNDVLKIESTINGRKFSTSLTFKNPEKLNNDK